MSLLGKNGIFSTVGGQVLQIKGGGDEIMILKYSYA